MDNFSLHLGYYIQEIARKTSVELNKQMKDLDLSYSQFRVINCLMKRGDLSQKDIIEDVVVKPPTLSKLLDLLEKNLILKRKFQNMIKELDLLV